MNKFFKCAFFIILILYYSNSHSQVLQQSLEDVLTEIEKKYQISFSYTDDTIKDIRIDFSYQEESVEKLLRRLERVTNLIFNRLDDRFVTVSDKNKAKTPNPAYYQQLEEVQIANYLTSGVSKNSVGGITVKPENFGILPGLVEPDVLQTIQALPGVLSVNEDVSNITIRGGTPDQNLVLYDDIRMYQTGHFFGLISAFNPNLIDNISVYRHGTQAKYGDAVSSVITMKLGDTRRERFKAGAGFNMISADAFAVLPLGKRTEVQLAARRSITDLVYTPTYQQYFERVFQDSDLTNIEDVAVSKNEKFYFSDLSLKFLYDISEKDQLRFNFLSIFNRLNYEEEAIASTRNTASKSELEQRSLGLGIRYNRQWNVKLKTFMQLYYSTYNLYGINSDLMQDQQLKQENIVLDDGVKLGSSYHFSPNFNLNTGFHFSQVSISNTEETNKPAFSKFDKNVVRTYATFAEGVYQTTNKKTTARIGVRHNYLKKFETQLIEPRVLLSQKLFDYFRIDLSGELKSQTTSQIIDLQKDFLGIEKRRWVVTDNDTVPIIKSKQANFGISYKQNDLLISVDAFIKRVDGITTRSQGFQNQFQFVNSVGNYDIKGVDFLINKQFPYFSTWLSYSISKNEYRFVNLNDNTTFPNNVDVHHVVNFSSALNINQLKLGLGINWHSAKPLTKPQDEVPVAAGVINYQSPNSRRLPVYLRTDFSGTYEFKIRKNKAVVGVSIWNLLNEKNIINTYYQLDNEVVSQVDNKALGTTPNVSFRFWF